MGRALAGVAALLLLGAACAFAPASAWPYRDTVYVSPGGSAGAAGSRAAPLGSLVEALGRASRRVVLTAGTHGCEGAAAASRGPLVVEGDPGAVVDCARAGDRASGGASGRFLSVTSAYATVANLTVRNAACSGGGCGLWAASLTLRVQGVAFEGCAASGNGSALYVHSASVAVENCTFEGNRAPAGAGGALYMRSGSLFVDRCSFVGNTAALGGALALQGGSAAVDRSRFERNGANTTAEGGYVWCAEADVSVADTTLGPGQSYCCLDRCELNYTRVTEERALWRTRGAPDADEVTDELCVPQPEPAHSGSNGSAAAGGLEVGLGVASGVVAAAGIAAWAAKPLWAAHLAQRAACSGAWLNTQDVLRANSKYKYLAVLPRRAAAVAQL